ncbi:MAG: cytochrome C oxidase subunit IV family protein [Bacteroidia bacterium]|nr:cytochrome C oxidase subunit IV family protein [Bacteroidia bacterium]
MEEEKRHIVGLDKNTLIWIDLLILTFVTISVAQFNFRSVTVIIALLIASTKSYLVITNFMHLKFESRMLKLMVGIAGVIFILILIALFLDYSAR